MSDRGSFLAASQEFRASCDTQQSFEPSQDLTEPPGTRRNLVAFWIAGLINNSSYVIMIAGAKQISSGGVGLVFLAGVVPSFIVSVTAPYWFHLVSYGIRFYCAAVLMCMCFVLVAFGDNLTVQLLGVCCAAAQSGLGEASFLALASQYPNKKTLLTMWSSGTGFAGIFGYGWVALLNTILSCSFTVTLMAANVLVVSWILTCEIVLERPEGIAWRALPCSDTADHGTQDALLDKAAIGDDDGVRDPHDIMGQEEVQPSKVPDSMGGRLRFICRELWPYTVPLVIVYTSEYAMQSGTWGAMGFPVNSKDARDKFYVFANWAYQGGVFISRSSGTLVSFDRRGLWAMPVMQAILLTFFYIDADVQFWYNWGLLAPCFCSGLLGGAVYVNALTLMCTEIEPECQALCTD